MTLVQGPNDPEPSRETMLALGGRIDQVVRAAAMASGIEPIVLSVEFVDHNGKVIAKTGAGAPKESSPAPKQAPVQQSASGIDGVKHIIAVGAGKGGVGKSTISVNLAVGLARKGHAVGLLDGDIYGPSLPTMLGLDAMDQTVLDGALQPFLVHGVKAVTMGKLVDADKPLIWRGPMAHGAFTQLAERTQWGELDYLVIDLPPGTGDVPLTMAQSLKLTGAVVVCTPQKVAQDDAVRAAKMFEQLGVEVLGVVENMSYFIGDDGKEYDIFGRGGAEKMAQRLGLPFLGSVPINTALRQNSDSGDPSANFDAETAGGGQLPKALERLVQNLEGQMNLASLKQGRSRPTLTVR
ncbi:MAG: sodium:proton antiporter [Planctomycetota bacterium]|nr:MAG: sodium:proton antiporter [Planctomycetota bacterium]